MPLWNVLNDFLFISKQTTHNIDGILEEKKHDYW